MDPNKEAVLLHADKQGGRDRAGLTREVSVGEHSSSISLEGRSYGGHSLHTMSTSACGPELCHCSNP